MKIRSFQQNHGEADGHREESQKLHVHRQGHRGQHLRRHQFDFLLGRFGKIFNNVFFNEKKLPQHQTDKTETRNRIVRSTLIK